MSLNDIDSISLNTSFQSNSYAANVIASAVQLIKTVLDCGPKPTAMAIEATVTMSSSKIKSALSSSVRI